MSLQAMRVQPHAEHYVHSPAIRRQLRRFPAGLRPAVTRLADSHVRLAELSVSFPALLVALAVPRARFDARPVISMVRAGAPLAVISQRAGVPLWLRRMEPRVLVAPLPPLPDGPFIRRSIVNHFPVAPDYSKKWFEMVSEGHHLVHEGFALWCAAQFSRRIRNRRWTRLYLLSLWAWYSGQPGTRGHALIEKGWSPEMEYKAAVDAAWRWHERLELEISLGARIIHDMWLKPGEVDGYSFVPLQSAAEIAEEARAMRNCLCTYGDDVLHGYSRLWSLRKNKERVATLEIAHRANDPLPHIYQLCLAENAQPPAELWLTAHKWLNSQDLPRLAPAVERQSIGLDVTAWRNLWKPYWVARRVIPDWLPLMPSRDALSAL